MSTTYLPYIATAAQALSDRKEEINRLNVFPVPDGDTGTNMSLTLDSVVREVSALGDDATLPEVCKAVIHGSLMGARGNSGVITSQILRGFCEGVEDMDKLDADTLDRGLARAQEVAFKAVRKPVAGTILTVLKDSAAAAHQAAEAGLSRDDALHAVTAAAFASVERTPELLPVLKENGVVDSGAFGLAVMLEGFASAVAGSEAVIPDTYQTMHPKAGSKVEIERIEDWEGSDYLYCTEFLVHSDQIDKTETLAFLSTMGDCELIVGERPDYKVHVHSNTPGTVLSYFTDRGQIAEVFIHNMKLQSDERDEEIAAEKSAAPTAAHKKLGVVAVGAGSGVKRILESLGVDYVVSGGQTMNPPTSELVEAVNSVDADAVILLPNNKNIIMTANTAVELCDKPMAVVPTKNVTQGFEALISINSEASLEENVALMTEVAEGVTYGEVTHAIRDAKSSKNEEIHEGDFIGLINDSLDVVGSSVEDVTLAILDQIVDEDSDTLTILAGQDLDDERFESLCDLIEERFEDLELDAQRGEQPVYPVMLSVE